MRVLALLTCLLLALTAPAGAAEMADLPSAFGGTQRVWYEAPANAWAVGILFMGGDGNAAIAPDGSIRRSGNFLVRTRQLWLVQGIAVLIPDKPAVLSERYGHRLTPAYAQDIRAMVSFAQSRSHAPIWLIGTSHGSNAVAVGAPQFTHGEIAGAVFTSSLTRPGGQAEMSDTVFGAPLAAINVPALVVAHQDDGCRLTPPADAEQIRAALSASPRREVMRFSGGAPPRSQPCEAMSQHGYLGIEAEVVARIAAWMQGR